MKKAVYFLILSVSLFSCKKEAQKTSGTAEAAGTLRYYQQVKNEDPIKFETDGPETFLFDDYTPNDVYDYVQKWKGSEDIHAQLTYSDTGKTGCDLGYQSLPCDYPLRVVHVVSYKHD